MLDFTVPELTTDHIVLTSPAVGFLIGDDRAVAPPPEPGSPAHIEISAIPWWTRSSGPHCARGAKGSGVS